MTNDFVTRRDLGKCAGRFFEAMRKPEYSIEKLLGLEGKTFPVGKAGDNFGFGFSRSGRMMILYSRENLGQIIRADLDMGRSLLHSDIRDRLEIPKNSKLSILCKSLVPGFSLCDDYDFDEQDSGEEVNIRQYRFFINETIDGKLYGLLAQLKYLQTMPVPQHI